MIWIATLALTAALYVWAHALRRSVRDITAHRDAADITRIEEGFAEREPEEWPRRQTPTDLAAAYEPVPVNRTVEWDTDAFEQLHRDFLDDQRRYQQAREWLDEILVDVRDGVLL